MRAAAQDVGIGKGVSAGQIDAMHLEAFHQAEVFWLDERARLDPWRMTGRVLSQWIWCSRAAP